jgi:hypothetical protein
MYLKMDHWFGIILCRLTEQSFFIFWQHITEKIKCCHTLSNLLRENGALLLAIFSQPKEGGVALFPAIFSPIQEG